MEDGTRVSGDDLSFVYNDSMNLYLYDSDNGSGDDHLGTIYISSTQTSGTLTFSDFKRNDTYELSFHVIPLK